MAKTKTKKPKKTASVTANATYSSIAIIAVVIATMNAISVKSTNNFISTINAVEYDNQLKPAVDEKDGYYTFTTDKDFKVVQLSDVHIGAGFMSTKKDIMAANAVEAMVRAEKPDLVVVTGDIGYPVPFQSGTLNNKNAAKIFANLMEKMGVYWCLTYGNHDTEAYSFFNRADISKIYSNKEKYPHCLFQSGPEDVDGYGNYPIKVKNSAGKITQVFFMIDSHSVHCGSTTASIRTKLIGTKRMLRLSPKKTAEKFQNQ